MNNARQELYDRIRESSKKEVILEEMVSLGFWNEADPAFQKAQGAIERTGELEREMRALHTELSRLENKEAMIRAIRKRNMAQAKERRAETKARRLAARKARAEKWRREKQRDILYLGDGHSQTLQDRESDAARLGRTGDLPVLHDAAQLASAMEISVGELRWLAFGRKVSKVAHYQRFYVPKKTGGLRLIAAPMPRLKEMQRWVLREILEKVPLHEAATGFRNGISILDNARRHVGSDVVINMDLKDFFPTLSYRRVKGVYRKLGYSGQVATILAMLTTEPEMDRVEMDGTLYWVARGERRLPQGAPSSPALTNIACRRLDRRLAALAEELGYRYSRYADDLTFSANGEAASRAGKILRGARFIVEQEGFVVHPDKTRVLRRGRRQEVTGIVVNDKLSVDRKTLRRFRATLHQVERHGPQGRTWGHSPDVIAALSGYATFVKMVDPERAEPFLAQLARIREKWGYEPPAWDPGPVREPSWQRYQPEPGPAESDVATEETAEAGGAAGSEAEARAPGEAESAENHKKPWWKFW